MPVRRKPIYCDYSLFSKLMETTPYTVRPYVIPMLFCVVVSTSAMKTQDDFVSHEIFPTDFNSDDYDAHPVVMLHYVINYPSISMAGCDWTFTPLTKMKLPPVYFIKHKIK